MSRELDQQILDWAKWADEHKRDGGDLTMKVAFLTKCVDGLMEMLARAAADLRELEGRPRENLGNPLYLPGQMRVRGDLRRIG